MIRQVSKQAKSILLIVLTLGFVNGVNAFQSPKINADALYNVTFTASSYSITAAASQSIKLTLHREYADTGLPAGLAAYFAPADSSMEVIPGFSNADAYGNATATLYANTYSATTSVHNVFAYSGGNQYTLSITVFPSPFNNPPKTAQQLTQGSVQSHPTIKPLVPATTTTDTSLKGNTGTNTGQNNQEPDAILLPREKIIGTTPKVQNNPNISLRSKIAIVCVSLAVASTLIYMCRRLMV